MPWTLYKHTDASAPVLNGTRGSLIALLDACLVTGYGDKAGAGWTKPYTATNKAAFRMGSGLLRSYVLVDQVTPTQSAEAEVRLYESMTDISTGVNPTTKVHARGSATNDSTPIAWWLVGDDRTFAFAATYAPGIPQLFTTFVCGEFRSFVPNDLYACLAIGRHTPGDNSQTSEPCAQLSDLGNLSAFRLSRDCVGVAKDRVVTALRTGYKCSYGDGPLDFPNPADGSLVLTPILLETTDSVGAVLRGSIRGLWASCHKNATIPFSVGDTVSGTGSSAGRTFVCIGRCASYNSTTLQGWWFLETSDTVERN